MKNLGRGYRSLLIVAALLGIILPVAVVVFQQSFPDQGSKLCATPGGTYLAQPLPADTMRFAAIGDFGNGSAAQQAVADLIMRWDPAFIISLGDNNYGEGSAATIDQHIGAYFHSFIGNYQGEYGEGASVNRFFPVLGNHDWRTDAGQPYLDYFSLPGNERYYTFTEGAVQFFALSSDRREPDGNSPDSVQAQWLQEQLAASTTSFQIVYLHHTPYSSGENGSDPNLRWPFAEWGVDAVLYGHDHIYERFTVDGIPYFVNGLGGSEEYGFRLPLEEGSEVQFNCDYGAMVVEASPQEVTFHFVTEEDQIIDTVRITQP
jgi:predicted phosphodiesterase